MADILIRGMEMPENKPLRLVLNPNGQLFVDHGVTFTEYEAVELPEHGRLIDADSLADDLLYDVELAERALGDTSLVGKEREYAQSEKDIKQNCAYYVSHAPVVIPSNKEETE